MSVRTRRFRAIGIGVLALLLLDQTVNLTLLADGRILGRRIAPFDPPLFHADQDASLERLRRVAHGEPQTGAIRWDAELGWTTPTREAASDSWFDELGARRPLADAPDSSAPPLSSRAVDILLIGCSVTYGDEVRPEETWAHALESALGARVANCGVSAYGIDQALLRLRRVGAIAKPKEVWLGILPKALPRLLSIYRPAMRHHEPSVSFKPRFRVVESGALDLVPNPAPTPEVAVDLLSTPGAFFAAVGEYDAFVANWPAAYRPFGSHLSHFLATSRIVLTQLENRTRPSVEVELADPTSELSRLAESVVATIAAEADQRGARFRVFVFPDADDLIAAAKGRPPIEPFVSRLRSRKLEVIGVERALLDAGATASAEWFRPGGHYSPRANAVLGTAMASVARR